MIGARRFRYGVAIERGNIGPDFRDSRMRRHSSNHSRRRVQGNPGGHRRNLTRRQRGILRPKKTDVGESEGYFEDVFRRALPVRIRNVFRNEYRRPEPILYDSRIRTIQRSGRHDFRHAHACGRFRNCNYYRRFDGYGYYCGYCVWLMILDFRPRFSRSRFQYDFYRNRRLYCHFRERRLP